MNTLTHASITSPSKRLPALRKHATGLTSDILTHIYHDEINIAIWERQPQPALQSAAQALINEQPTLQTTMSLTPSNAYRMSKQSLGTSDYSTTLSEDIALLVDMFCCLFEAPRAGLRLTALNRAMCPRFHVDKVPCRLVTTYEGCGTQWLPHQAVDRSKLGAGSAGQPDELSGLYQTTSAIQQINAGAIALLKGENWAGNEGAGLVHRSPPVESDNPRLLLTLDALGD